jgi:ribonuclease P/MRP protein subunit POP5
MVRFKNRWLLVEFIPSMDGAVSLHHQLARSGAELNGKHVWSALKQSVISNFGDAGWGAVGYSLTGTSLSIGKVALLTRGISVKYFSPITNICIIRVGREHVRTAWGAVTLLNSIEGRKVLPNVVHVSGASRCSAYALVRALTPYP